MKLLILRHGESEDDLIDAYGGWADFPLTASGIETAKQNAEKISKLNEKFDIVLASPLKRAVQTAEVIAQKLGIKSEIFEYIKERNMYGIMCGMVKADAKKKFPWLVEAYEKWEYIDGQERAADILTRTAKAYELIQKMGYNSVILATHGNFVEAFFKQNFGKKIIKKEMGGFILLETDGDKCSVIKAEGIEID